MLLYDAEHSLGNDAEARAAREKVISESGGRHVHGRALALFLADHDLDPAQAVRLMETDWQTRKDVETADALAWASLKVEKPAEAQKFVDLARKQGYVAPIFLWHAGRIAEALKNTLEARNYYQRALKINPNFHPLGAPDARFRLENLK